jgi:hypothetical protein
VRVVAFVEDTNLSKFKTALRKLESAATSTAAAEGE